MDETWSDKEVVLKLQQSWYLADGTGDSEDAVWNIPLAIATAAKSGSNETAFTASLFHLLTY